MPALDDNTQKITNGGWRYSNTPLEELKASSYTLGCLVVDVTGSMTRRVSDMERIMKEIVLKLKDEPTAQNIQWRVVIFDDHIGVEELHGYMLLANIDESVYSIKCYGSTNLHDAVIASIEATVAEAERLYKEEYDVNAIITIITDGEENASSPKNRSASSVANAVGMAMNTEKLDSIRTILVGVNNGFSGWKNGTSTYLEKFQKEAGLTDYVDIDEFDEKAIKRIILQISSITSDTSQLINTGGPSQMTF